jgi:hypothetical protein
MPSKPGSFTYPSSSLGRYNRKRPSKPIPTDNRKSPLDFSSVGFWIEGQTDGNRFEPTLWYGSIPVVFCDEIHGRLMAASDCSSGRIGADVDQGIPDCISLDDETRRPEKCYSQGCVIFDISEFTAPCCDQSVVSRRSKDVFARCGLLAPRMFIVRCNICWLSKAI